ncbi:MAG: L,D-transpeptidase [Hyphomicrobiales bacterium]|nr:MAG: L,D-transpeptidase [Hyphomicrobiales bacterium]
MGCVVEGQLVSDFKSQIDNARSNAGRTSRRAFLIGAASMALVGCSGSSQRWGQMQESNAFRSAYGPLPNEPYPIPAVDTKRVPRQFQRQLVHYRGAEPYGTVVVDPRNKHLYLVREDGMAVRYGVGVGRAGFEWQGDAKIGAKKPWPTWTPPSEMIDRQPELEQYRRGMAPGLQNPLGARALYLYSDGRDTLYRIHGTNEPWSIGKAVSSGCIRMFNQDIIDLYERVSVGARVVVL